MNSLAFLRNTRKICSALRNKEKITHTLNDFIKKAQKTHGNKYNYSLVNYVNSHTKIKIICPKHGEFEQLPCGHIFGHGCKECTSSVSKPENQISSFLKSNNIDITTSSRSIISPNQLDIYIPSHNIAIEFNGLYWHSEEYLHKNYHLNKTELCDEKNIQLIHVFEDEWGNKQNIVKSMLKNKLGLTENKIYARECEIKEVNNKESKNFLENNHIQGNIYSKYKIGLYHNNELISLMNFSELPIC